MALAFLLAARWYWHPQLAWLHSVIGTHVLADACVVALAGRLAGALTGWYSLPYWLGTSTLVLISLLAGTSILVLSVAVAGDTASCIPGLVLALDLAGREFAWVRVRSLTGTRSVVGFADQMALAIHLDNAL